MESATITTASSDAYYTVGSKERPFVIDYILDGGTELKITTRKDIDKRSSLAGSQTDRPQYYCPYGTDVSGDPQIRLFPVPDGVYSLELSGFRPQGDLSADADELIIPSKPVVYLALALAARERGEVGGQTADEIFSMATAYLSDAIALDAANNNLNNIWTVE